jgi:hypothetical protein
MGGEQMSTQTPFTKEAFMRELDDAGIPAHERRENGGRAHPQTKRYGNWLRITYPTDFLKLYDKAIKQKNVQK